MTKKITLSVVAATVLATSVYATNGDNLIGTGAASRAMGGTGVANYTNGIEALYRNPALMGQSKTNTASLAMTYFDPTVTSTVTNPAQGFPATNKETSTTEASIIPEMGVTYNLSETLHFGFGIFGAAGMGANYQGENSHSQIKSELSLARIIPGVSYDINEMISVGIAPVITYGQMALNYDAGTGSQSTREMSTSTAFGAQIGLAIRPVENLTIGLTYNSAAKLTYSNVANFEQFGVPGAVGSAVQSFSGFSDTLTLSDAAQAGLGKTETTTLAQDLQAGFAGSQFMNNPFFDQTQAESLTNPSQASVPIAAADLLGFTDATGTKFSDLAGAAAGAAQASMEAGTHADFNAAFGAAITEAGVAQDSAEAGAIAAQLGAQFVGAEIVTVAGDAANVLNAQLGKAAAAADDDLDLEQPAELALGVAYKMDDLALTADFRSVQWSQSEGYKDFGWNDQTVIALGASYDLGSLTLRAGYNQADSVLDDISGEAGNNGTVNLQGHQVFQQAISMLNMVGFPAIATTHFTFGLGYAIDDAMSVDFAAVISPENEVSRKGTVQAPDQNFQIVAQPYDFTSTMQQNSYTIAFNYNF
jgi:long-subunit fatty acid transport protein